MAKVYPLGVGSSELDQFFEFMYGDETGYVYSPTKNPVTNAFEQYFFQWPTERQSLLQHIRRYSATHEVYYGPALFSLRDATKESFLGTNVVWAEFDGILPSSLANVPEPSVKVQSSTVGHEHWYWRLEHFVRDQSIIEDISQRITYHLQADLSCWNANRVLRPPGTLHHESAKQTYLLRWDPRPHSLVAFAKLPELPVKLLGIGDIHAVPETLEVICKYPFTDEAISLFKAKLCLCGKPEGCEKGIHPKSQRSSALAKMAHFCMEMGMTNAETLSILYNVDDRWKKFAHRDDRKVRLLGLINSVRVKHPVDIVERDAESIFRIYTYREFMDTELKIDWVVPGLVHQKGLMSISGPPNVGKSQLCLRLAEKMAKAQPFLKWDITAPLKTIFVSMEMAHEELKFMMESMEMEDSNLLSENLNVLPLGASIRLNNRAAQGELNKLIEKVQPHGIFLDSFGVAVGEDISNDKVIFETLDYVHRTLRLEYGAFVGFIHHPRKEQIGNKQPKKLDDLYGSRYYGAALSTALGLWGVGPDIEVSCLKLRLAKPFDAFRIRRTSNLDFRMIRDLKPQDINDAPLLFMNDDGLAGSI